MAPCARDRTSYNGVIVKDIYIDTLDKTLQIILKILEKVMLLL